MAHRQRPRDWEVPRRMTSANRSQRDVSGLSARAPTSQNRQLQVLLPPRDGHHETRLCDAVATAGHGRRFGLSGASLSAAPRYDEQRELGFWRALVRAARVDSSDARPCDGCYV